MMSFSRGRTAGIGSALLVVAAIAGTAACFGDESDEAEDDPNPEVADAGEAGSDAATGTLVLGSETIEFIVDACDLASEPAAGRPTLSGHAELPDGRTLQITMLRTPMGSTTWQSVALDFGGEYREARRGRSEGDDGWRPIAADPTEPALGPLIEIDGRSVSAEGSFLPGSGGASGTVRASVTATCPGS